MSAEVTTYRYVRFSMLALLLALAISVATETVRGGWQTSISSYYYTPAGPIFIGSLVALGVCLVALRGYTDAEDVCLNLAGISAPMIAFVPTPDEGRHPDVHAIWNSAGTYLAVLAIGYVVVLVAVVRTPGRPSLWGYLGMFTVPVAWAVGTGWLIIDRNSFALHAHAMAATFTFIPFAGVVVLNTDWGVRVIAREGTASRTRFDTAYWAVAAAMAVVVVVCALLHSWTYAFITMEIGELVLFAVFWVLQTIDLMDPQRDRAVAPGSRLARRA
jgi:hypothetical protein